MSDGRFGFATLIAFVLNLNSLDCVCGSPVGCLRATQMDWIGATPISLGLIEITSVGPLGDV